MRGAEEIIGCDFEGTDTTSGVGGEGDKTFSSITGKSIGLKFENVTSVYSDRSIGLSYMT